MYSKHYASITTFNFLFKTFALKRSTLVLLLTNVLVTLSVFGDLIINLLVVEEVKWLKFVEDEITHIFIHVHF